MGLKNCGPIGSTSGTSVFANRVPSIFIVIAIMAVPGFGFRTRPFGALTGSMSPSPTVGVTNTNIVGTATPGATVTESDTCPDGTAHGPYSTTANGSGNYTLGPFILQQLGTYTGTLHDSISGVTIPFTYSGAGNFSVSVNTASQTVTQGNAASYTVTVSSVAGFAGTAVCLPCIVV